MTITLELLFVLLVVQLLFVIYILVILNRKIKRLNAKQDKPRVDPAKIKQWNKTLKSLPHGSPEREAYAKRLIEVASK